MIEDETSPEHVRQTHYGSGHNIFARTVNIGSPRFELTDDIMREVLANTPEHPVVIESWNGARSEMLARKLKEFLERNGRIVHRLRTIGASINLRPPATPIEIKVGSDETLIQIDATA